MCYYFVGKLSKVIIRRLVNSFLTRVNNDLTGEITHIENDGFLGVLCEYFLGIVCMTKEDVERYIFNSDEGRF
jgi:hypothetical protein